MDVVSENWWRNPGYGALLALIARVPMLHSCR